MLRPERALITTGRLKYYNTRKAVLEKTLRAPAVFRERVPTSTMMFTNKYENNIDLGLIDILLLFSIVPSIFNQSSYFIRND